MKRLFIIAFFWAMAATAVMAQKPTVEWSVDFKTIFDNREGDETYTEAETFFMTQLAPEIGLSLDNGRHTVMGGVVWTQPIGCEWDGHRVSPTLYYRYRRGGTEGWLGMFGREQLARRLPDYIWNDSCYYVQRNIRGAGIVMRGNHGFVQGVLDWRGMQTEKQREAFNIIVDGEWRRGGNSVLTAGGTAMMNHLARRKNAPVEEQVVDNFIANPYIGADFTEKATWAERLTLKGGVLASMTRDRGTDHKWVSRGGVWIEGCIDWRRFSFREEAYGGGRLFPYYSRYGSVLDQGEPYYASPWYSRTDVGYAVIRSNHVKLEALLDFHAAKDNFNFYQRLILQVRF